MTIKTFLKRLFWYDKWDIGVYHGDIASFVKSAGECKITWLGKFGRYSFVADPFIFHSGTSLKILAEYFNYFTCKGKIISIESGADFENPVISDEIVTQCHMSYPQMFEYNGEKYCIPETCKANKLMLYKFNRISGKFEYLKDLIVNFAAVDSTILYYQGKWWLFCTKGGRKANADLYIFHSDSPLQNWQLHKNNPVKSDICSARPAGDFFYVDGKLHRPAQNCGKTYGGSIIINEILKLDEESFEERQVAEIKPAQDSPYMHGLHNLSIGDNIVVIDGKKLQFSLLNPLFIILQRLATRFLYRV
jgi:hypothetical protein